MPSVDDLKPQTTSPLLFTHTSGSLKYAVTHVCLPIQLSHWAEEGREKEIWRRKKALFAFRTPENKPTPPENEPTPQESKPTSGNDNDYSLALAVCAAAYAYGTHVHGTTEQAHWHRIAKMLDNLQISVQPELLERQCIASQLLDMQTGDILLFFVRRQASVIILTKQANCTLVEAFEVSLPDRYAVRETEERSTYSYPSTAVEIPSNVFYNCASQFELARLLSLADTYRDDRPSIHPKNIVALLRRILQGIGRAANGFHIIERTALLAGVRAADVPCITKRIRDEDTRSRSRLWLLVRVAVQMSVERSLGRASYKQFLLYFICTLSMDKHNTDLSGDLLQLLSSKILRRLSKLGSSTPGWLTTMALETCHHLRGILSSRQKELNACISPFRNPSEAELARDTQLSLEESGEYICSALENHDYESIPTSFHPSHRHRGTIEDFLSANGAFFDEAYSAEPDVTLYDVERSIEQDLDEWLAQVADVNQACIQLAILTNKYMKKKLSRSPEEASIKLLTSIELCVALDKLTVREVPLLAEYSPGFSIAPLEDLLLRGRTSLHRLSCAHQYFSMRNSRSRPGWLMFSGEFTEDSFPIRYYNQSPRLQELKARIEEELTGRDRRNVRTGTDDEHDECLEQQRPPLPDSPLHRKVVVFELQCPPCIRIWHAAMVRNQLDDLSFSDKFDRIQSGTYLADVPALQPYLQGPPLGSKVAYLAYFYLRDSRNNPILRYVVNGSPTSPLPDKESRRKVKRLLWQRRTRDDLLEDLDLDDLDLYLGLKCTYYEFERSSRGLESYARLTNHTSNDVLSAQTRCPTDLSFDEFITFGHLRSGPSLQWLNILHGLRSRTLNLRRREVHYLLAHAAFQVGPLDPHTGTWIWHRELEDPSFCSAILDELHDLLTDVGAVLVDGVLMNTISLLLTRVLASSPSEDISQRAIALLRSLRRKTFSWVQDLLYDLRKAPANEERRALLLDMAATCRSTFDVGPALRELLHTAEDVDAVVSCAFFIWALCPRPSDIDEPYLTLLILRDRRLSLTLEDPLKHVILADALDYGIDLAVPRIFFAYQPNICRWRQWLYPYARWLTCNTRQTVDRPLRTVYINPLDGSLRVDGRPCRLPGDLWRSSGCEEIFGLQEMFLSPSDLPGMDLMSFSLSPSHTASVHFAVRHYNLVVRAQNNQTGEILELIPPGTLRADLPSGLIDDHVCWLRDRQSIDTRVVEVRPRGQLWEESSENWEIHCIPRKYRMCKGRETLVDIRSPTGKMFVECFDCLSTNLLITIFTVDSGQSKSASRLSVNLPHYGLSFFINEKGELESHDFGHMVYDENQSVGTLCGLKSMLVLRLKTYIADTLLPEGLVHRRVIIPNGSPKMHDDHRVRIDTTSTRFGGPLYQVYDVDTELECLIGDGGLMNEAYLAHLHAMTDSHLPDPLTGKTGLQASLSYLQSGGCWSVMKLKALDVSSTEYPQINAAYISIRNRYYWDSASRNEAVSVLEKRAARLTAYLFSFTRCTIEPSSAKEHRHHEGSYPLSAESHPSTLLPAVLSLRQTMSGPSSSTEITLDTLICTRTAPVLMARSVLRSENSTTSANIPSLDQLFGVLRADSTFREQYLARLRASAQHAHETRTMYRVAGTDRVGTLTGYYLQCRSNYMDSLGTLKKRLGPTDNPYEQKFALFGQWPPITAPILLRYLASTSPIPTPPHWKKCLTSLALLLLDLQRARRLLLSALDRCEEEFSKELGNEACDGWNPEDYPDWLLIQIQGNFLIRRAQVETAMQLMSPRSGDNTVMQLNMGEGKSSVIVPIAAAALANGKQLVRVVVPKALTVQMFELLVSRLGWLANRPIYHLPFSRSAQENCPQIGLMCKLVSQCMTERGILLVQPEHVVSLKLMAVEQQMRKCKLTTHLAMRHQKSIYKRMKTIPSLQPVQRDDVVDDGMFQLRDDWLNEDRLRTLDTASKWLSLQKWLHLHARDILDESDEILHARFQLVYTFGFEQHLDGYPERWTIIQQILKHVKKHVYSFSSHVPELIECDRGTPGSFPQVRILRPSEVIPCLISSIVEDVIAGRLSSFDFQDTSAQKLDAIQSFISDPDVLDVPDTVRTVMEYAKSSNQNHLWNGLLLLRGLLTSNILISALAERRFRVDYGPVSSTKLAVPYRAKDVPAPNTQFGHPDLTIILTCLSSYYAGLTEEQLRHSFEILLNQDNPTAEYIHWIEECDGRTLPESLQTLRNINLRSSEQWDNVILPLFARNQATIDFYLSRVVFPTEAKEFPRKLSGSSWDLAEKRKKLITGFSGTNDGEWLLPVSITQRDPAHQKGTNARVLAYLLRPENSSYTVTTSASDEKFNTSAFLRQMTEKQPEIRVLLDVGSQILDLSNRQVASAWLEISRDTAAAIYFSEDDELVVLTRNGSTAPMSSSPLSQQLERCVVYLDHAHTRGTDIKFPMESRAAITLGPKVTKDALVQGCMRMRKLGHGHSVAFVASPAVDRSIRAVTGKADPNSQVTTVDVLCWVIHETWSDIQQRAPYWAHQGMNHKLRYNAWSDFVRGKFTREELAGAWLQIEGKSLEDLYAPRKMEDTPSDLSALDPEIHRRCKNLGVLSHSGTWMDEEQEREVNRQREREVELPPSASPAKHRLHPGVILFVKTGVLLPLSGFRPVFTTLQWTHAATHKAGKWNSSLLATIDFCKTIKPQSVPGTTDQYCRPVQWVLSNKDRDKLVLLSPFEADCLLPDIRTSKHVHLHLYVPRTSQRMKPYDELQLYAIPSLPSDWTPPLALIDQLNIFAGQLYLRDYGSYHRLCELLGVPATIEERNSMETQRGKRKQTASSCSPGAFVQAILEIRRRGQPFGETHVGRILQGQILTTDDFPPDDPRITSVDKHESDTVPCPSDK